MDTDQNIKSENRMANLVVSITACFGIRFGLMSRRPLMSTFRILLVCSLFLCSALLSAASVQLDFLHSYTNRVDGLTHYSFHLSKTKRGLFCGPCGFSTRRIDRKSTRLN